MFLKSRFSKRIFGHSAGSTIVRPAPLLTVLTFKPAFRVPQKEVDKRSSIIFSFLVTFSDVFVTIFVIAAKGSNKPEGALNPYILSQDISKWHFSRTVPSSRRLRCLDGAWHLSCLDGVSVWNCLRKSSQN